MVAIGEFAKTTDVKAAAKLVRDARISLECVPTPLLAYAEIWDALLAADGRWFESSRSREGPSH